MGSDLWRWADPAGQQRKVRLDELRAALAGGLIAPNTPVWRSGWHAWQPAHEVPELTSASLGGANGVVLNIPPPPLAMVAVQQEYEASSGSLAPAPPPPADDEPPPPPHYVPAPVKPSVPPPSMSPLKTQLGGSAHMRAASVTPSPSKEGSSVAPGSVPRQGPSLPTAIGLPPPPELAAAVAAATPRGRSAPPPPPPRVRPSVPPPRPPGAGAGAGMMIEELSGSSLLDAPTGDGGPAPPGGAAPIRSSNPSQPINGVKPLLGGLPPPTDPVIHERGPDEGMDDDAGIPRRPSLSLIFQDLAAIRQGKPPKNKLLVGVLAALALSVAIMIIAGIVSLASGPSASEKKAAASASAMAKSSPPPAVSTVATSTAAPPAPIPVAVPVEEPKAKDSASGECTGSGDAKLIAPRAVIASGIETHALGGGLALGFAAAPREAVATILDPSSLSPTSTVRTRPTGGDARRVAPMLVAGKLTALPDVERKGDHLVGRRVVSTTTLIDVGHADGGIVWAPHGRDSFAKLFPVEGETQVDALRAIALTDRKGIGVAFRHGNAIHFGAAKGDGVLEADGELSKVAGLGQVGSPAIAASGDRLVVAWADRSGPQDDWKIRWTKVKVGSTTEEAVLFSLPDGGLGGQAMSPSIASLGGGRFLLAWTEGPVSSHQVRAIMIGADGSPAGSPISISASGVNAGQPAAVVGADGRGAVAFLAAKGKSLEVHATPISCPAR